MGKPAELGPKERVAANTLADAIVKAIVNDEPIADAICVADLGEHDAQFYQSPDLSEGEQLVILQLAQQNRDLRAALVEALQIAHAGWIRATDDPKHIRRERLDQLSALATHDGSPGLYRHFPAREREQKK
jgi:hypothetical protein